MSFPFHGTYLFPFDSTLSLNKRGVAILSCFLRITKNLSLGVVPFRSILSESESVINQSENAAAQLSFC